MLQLTDRLRRSAQVFRKPDTAQVEQSVQRLLDLANSHPHMKYLRNQPTIDTYIAYENGIGFGQYAFEDIPQNTLVFFTDGKIKIDSDPRERDWYLFIDMMVPVQGNHFRTVDAVYTLDDLWYVNHACANPNMTAVTTIINGGSLGYFHVVAYYTNRHVNAGEQLTIDYYNNVSSTVKKQVLDNHPKPGFVKCRCSHACPNYIRALPVVPLDEVH